MAQLRPVCFIHHSLQNQIKRVKKIDAFFFPLLLSDVQCFQDVYEWVSEWVWACPLQMCPQLVITSFCAVTPKELNTTLSQTKIKRQKLFFILDHIFLRAPARPVASSTTPPLLLTATSGAILSFDAYLFLFVTTFKGWYPPIFIWCLFGGEWKRTPCAQAALILLETSPSKHLNNKPLSKHRH